MISRFFKKSKPASPAKKGASAPAPASKPEGKKKTTTFQKILTAEGWKRLMMKKYGSPKK